MKTIQEREVFDDYELPDEVDFSYAVRGRFYQPKKASTTIRLDDDILLFFKKRAKEERVSYEPPQLGGFFMVVTPICPCGIIKV